jgi:putative hemolysin
MATESNFSIAGEILVIFLLLLCNGLFALAEIAVISSRKVRLQQLSSQGDKQAQVALELANNPNQILSTVQIGITLIGILAGAYGGANIANHLEKLLQYFPILGTYRRVIALVIVVIIITYFSLVIGELVPKRLALNNPEGIARMVAFPLRWFSKIAAPLVHLLSASTNLVLHLLGSNAPSSDLPFTEEEIKVMFQQGKDAGMFEEAEHDMVERVLRLGDRKVGAMMTPRPEIVWLNLEDSAEANRQRIISVPHKRFPVCQGSLDEVLGVVQVTNLLASCLSGEVFDLTGSLVQPLFIPESTRGLKVLEQFQETGNHIAFIVDEYGVIQGLVTLNDILEAIVGDISRIDESEAPQIVRREDGSWLLDGVVSIDELKELFEIEEFPGEKQGNYHTLAGFIITHLGKIPTAAEHFEWQGLRFEIMDMDGNRIDKVLIMSLNQDNS